MTRAVLYPSCHKIQLMKSITAIIWQLPVLLKGVELRFYLLLTYSDTKIVEYDGGSTTSSTESVAKDDYTLQYVHEVISVDYSQNGRIACEGRNFAAGNLQKSDTKEKNITIGEKEIDEKFIFFIEHVTVRRLQEMIE